jgi:hypothetical protein
MGSIEAGEKRQGMHPLIAGKAKKWVILRSLRGNQLYPNINLTVDSSQDFKFQHYR